MARPAERTLFLGGLAAMAGAVLLAYWLLLALTPIPWRMGTFADPHTLHLALVAALLVLLVGWEARRRAGAPRADRWLVASAVLYGVMLGNHTLAILLAPGIALFVVAAEPGILLRPRFVALCAGALLGTSAALYLQLPIRAAMGAPLVYGRPDTWDGFWYVVLAEQFEKPVPYRYGGVMVEADDQDAFRRGPQHPDEDVVRAGHRVGDLGEHETRPRLLLDDRLHACLLRAAGRRSPAAPVAPPRRGARGAQSCDRRGCGPQRGRTQRLPPEASRSD